MAIVVNGTTLTKVNVGEVNIKKVYARAGESGAYVLVFQGETTTMIYFGGNWKMNMLKSSIDSYFEAFNELLIPNNQKKVIIFPPACYLDYVKSKISSELSDMVEIGIQNIGQERKGAYTGQISAEQAKDCGCTYALIGEAEVKDYLGDTLEMCGRKIYAAMSSGLNAFYIVGENLQEHQNGLTESVIANQLYSALNYNQNLNQYAEYIRTNKIIIVYEPVWSIGTGVIALPSDLQNGCNIIREWLRNMINEETADKAIILTTGSINAGNASEIMSGIDINGLLVAGASNKPVDFSTIINEV